jgi:hypothetical protein
MVLDQHTDLTGRTIGALEARLAKAKPSAPEFNHRLRHHRAAALPALHHCCPASLSLDPFQTIHRTDQNGGSFGLAEDSSDVITCRSPPPRIRCARAAIAPNATKTAAAPPDAGPVFIWTLALLGRSSGVGHQLCREFLDAPLRIWRAVDAARCGAVLQAGGRRPGAGSGRLQPARHHTGRRRTHRLLADSKRTRQRQFSSGKVLILIAMRVSPSSAYQVNRQAALPSCRESVSSMRLLRSGGPGGGDYSYTSVCGTPHPFARYINSP